MKRYYVLDSDDLLEASACDPRHATAVVLATEADEAIAHEKGKLVDLRDAHRKEMQEAQREFQQEMRDAVAEARAEARENHGF